MNQTNKFSMMHLHVSIIIFCSKLGMPNDIKIEILFYGKHSHIKHKLLHILDM